MVGPAHSLWQLAYSSPCPVSVVLALPLALAGQSGAGELVPRKPSQAQGACLIDQAGFKAVLTGWTPSSYIHSWRSQQFSVLSLGPIWVTPTQVLFQTSQGQSAVAMGPG